jgi:hypothetical protein
MEIWMILFIMLGHWIADFVGQTDQMARNKSISIWWLTNHVGAYTSVMTIWISFLIIGRSLFGDVMLPDIFLLVPVVILIFITHWVTDFITSKITTKLWERGKMHNFFVVIGFDQWLHLVQLLIIYKVFLLN